MVDQQVFHINADGSSIDAPEVTQQNPQQNILHIDSDGNVIGQNGQLRNDLLKSIPKGNVDIGENMPSWQQIGTAVAKGLPAIGATVGTAIGAEGAAPISGPLGAAGGTAVANILKSYAPQYFTENGKAPDMQKQLTDIGVNAGLEGTGQVVARAIPEAARLGLKGIAQLPPFRSEIKRSSNEVAKQKLIEQSQPNTDQAKALKSVLLKGMKKDQIVDTDAIRKELDEGDYHAYKSVNVPGIGPRQVNTDLIPQEIRDNIKKIMDQTDKLKESSGKGDTEGLINWKNGKYMMKYGVGVGLDKALGIGHPYLTGSAVLGGIQLGQKALTKIAQSPALTEAMTKAMDPATSPAMQKLLQQGLLQGLRGTEVEYQLPDGKSETTTIGPDGRPQLPR